MGVHIDVGDGCWLRKGTICRMLVTDLIVFFSRKHSSQQHHCRPPWFSVISHNLCASEWFEGFNNYHLGSVGVHIDVGDGCWLRKGDNLSDVDDWFDRFCPAHIQVSNITVGYLDFQLSHITYVPVSDLKDSIIITLVQSRVFKMKGSLFPGFYKE